MNQGRISTIVKENSYVIKIPKVRFTMSITQFIQKALAKLWLLSQQYSVRNKGKICVLPWASTKKHHNRSHQDPFQPGFPPCSLPLG